MKVCSTTGCPELTTHTRCPTHERQADRARGTRQQRGYDNTHYQLRAQWRPRVDTGQIHCARCGLPIAIGQQWDLDHSDDRTTYRGPSHRQCNTAAAGRKSHGLS